MSHFDSQDYGHADGWSVEEMPLGQWRWLAWYQGTRRTGKAMSKGAARSKAQAARSELAALAHVRTVQR